MAVDWTRVMTTLGAELSITRKPQAFFEHFHEVSSSSYSKRQIQNAYDPTADVYQEVAVALDSNLYEKSVSPTVQGILSSMKLNFEQAWFPYLDSQLNTNPADKQAGAISYVYDPQLTDGTVGILTRQGRLAALRAQMIADNKSIRKNVVTFGSLVPIGENFGTLTLTSLSGRDHCLTGKISIICVDETVGAEKFTVQNTLTKKLPDQNVQTTIDGLFSIISADNQLQIGKMFEDGPMGITIQIDLDAPIVTDPSNLFISPGAVNLSGADSNHGIIYMKVTRQASDPYWLVQWYSDAALTQLVTQTQFFGLTGTSALSMSGSSTNFQATFDMGAAATAMPSTGNTYLFTFNANIPRINDQWTIDVTNDESGLFATKLAHLYRASLNSLPVAPVGTPSAVLAGVGAGSVDDGVHQYVYTYIKGGVESAQSPIATVTVVDKSVDGKVDVSGIAPGPSGTTSRNVYRTTAGGSTFLFLFTVAGNVTTSFQDNTADSGLGTTSPTEQINDALAASVSMT